MSEATGQHTTLLTLTNVGNAGCHLFGYPSVVLSDSRGELVPFTYRQSGDMMLSGLSPARVELAPKARAYVAINKYRCDTVEPRFATSISLTLPTVPGSLRLVLGQERGVAYCGAGDPGSQVDISPIRSTEGEVLR